MQEGESERQTNKKAAIQGSLGTLAQMLIAQYQKEPYPGHSVRLMLTHALHFVNGEASGL